MASIKKRGKSSYEITVSLGRDLEGKKKVKTKTVTLDPNMPPKQREKALQQMSYEFEAQVKSGKVIDSGMTLAAFAEKWMSDYVEKHLQPTTAEGYRGELEGKIIPALGHIKLKELTPLALIGFYDNLLEDGVRMDGKPGGYSTRVIKYQHQIISSMLQTAVRWRLIRENVAQFVRPPKGVDSKGKGEMDEYGNKKENCLNDEQVSEFLQFVLKSQPLKYQALALMAAFGGMRKGEMLALTWHDVDFDNQTVSITKSLARLKGELITKAPKNNTSVRTISLPASVMLVLKSLKAQSTSIKVLPMGYGVPTEWYRNTIKKYNEAIDADTAIAVANGDNKYKPKPKLQTHTTLHGLRHTSATLLIAQGTDVKTVSARLGHSSTTVTLNTYTHALRKRDELAANALDELINIEIEAK